MFECSTLRVYLSCIFMILSLSAATVSAESSYQFSFGGYGSKLDYDGADGEGLGLNAAAYLESIKLNDSMPYNLTPFYSRVSGLFLNSSKSRVSDLNQVMSGRVLKKWDGHSSSISIQLANAELPVWGALGYSRVGSSHYYFSDGTEATFDRRYIRSATVGWFVNDAFGIFAFKEDDNDVDGKGFGAHYLYNLGSLGFIEGALQYMKVDDDGTSLEVVNGAIRYANENKRTERVRDLGLRYFPTVKTEIGVRYRKMDYEYDSYGYSFTTSASYYLLSNLQLGISFHEVFQDDVALRLGKVEYSALTGNVNFKF